MFTEKVLWPSFFFSKAMIVALCNCFHLPARFEQRVVSATFNCFILLYYFQALLKPQYVDLLAKQLKGTVRSVIERKSEVESTQKLIKDLDMEHLMDRQISDLSGGELQRFAVLATTIQLGNVYMFDEPSSYLDVKQRLQVARVIRSLLHYDNYIIVVRRVLGFKTSSAFNVPIVLHIVRS